MKKRLFCFALTLCMCFSFPLVSAAQGESATGGNLQDDLSALGSLVETNSPAGAVGIAYDISSGTTRYYGISGNVLADANISEPLTVPGWFPETETSVIGGGDSVNGIIGSDDRTLITNTKTMPYSAIVCIEVTFPSRGTFFITAFMISETVALTAAHCIYDVVPEGGIHEWATSVKAMPGKNGKTFLGNPYGSCQATELVIPVPYYESSDKNDSYDWGLIRLDENIGSKTGYFGFQFIPHAMTGMNVTITGYPVSDSKHRQWSHSGEIVIPDLNPSDLARFDYDYIIHYYIDAEDGQSGSPVYYLNNGQWTVVGIHTSEWPTSQGVMWFNEGVRFTSQMFSFVWSYRAG